MTNALAFERPRRWAVLGVYALVAGVSQMLWLNFAPLLTFIQKLYGVGELQASLLIVSFPLLYVVFSIHAGKLTDARGYRFAVGLGASLMTAFSFVRIFDGSFWALLVGQIGIAVAQPYIVNGVSKLVADWFTEKQGAVATGLATVGMFLGMAAGMVATPILVDALSLRGAMIVFAVVTLATAVAFAFVVHPNAIRSADAAPSSVPATLGQLLRNRKLLLLFTLSLLGLGVFNGLTTWIEQILAPHGIDAEQAGKIGGAIIGGGIVGAAIIPLLSDLSKRRKPYLLVCVVGALATIHPLCSWSNYASLLVYGGLHGFFFLPALALLLEMSSQIAGAASAGAATGVVMLTGNAGGVVVALAMPLIRGDRPDFGPAVLLMVALLAIALVLATFATETYVHEPPGS